ncbi:hypothetical protein VTN00DRAFT_938 [Thermoascus crustaceus]|uniref:uncharacterized protein n=1 Tax=Thermoascus crustaceus TaxID=5088 RepID=UPI0037442151
MEELPKCHFSDSNPNSSPFIEPDPCHCPWSHPALDIGGSVPTPPASLWSDVDINDGYGSGEGEGDTFVYDCKQCSVKISDIEGLRQHLLDGGRASVHVVCPLCLKEFVGDDMLERERELKRHVLGCPLSNGFFLGQEERLLLSPDRVTRGDVHDERSCRDDKCYYASDSSAGYNNPDFLLFDIVQDLSNCGGDGHRHSDVKLVKSNVCMDINTPIHPQDKSERVNEPEHKRKEKTNGNLETGVPAEAEVDINAMLLSTVQPNHDLEDDEENMNGCCGCSRHLWDCIPSPGYDLGGTGGLDPEKIRAEHYEEMNWLETFEGA